MNPEPPAARPPLCLARPRPDALPAVPIRVAMRRMLDSAECLRRHHDAVSPVHNTTQAGLALMACRLLCFAETTLSA